MVHSFVKYYHVENATALQARTAKDQGDMRETVPQDDKEARLESLVTHSQP